MGPAFSFLPSHRFFLDPIFLSSFIFTSSEVLANGRMQNRRPGSSGSEISALGNTLNLGPGPAGSAEFGGWRIMDLKGRDLRIGFFSV